MQPNGRFRTCSFDGAGARARAFLVRATALCLAAVLCLCVRAVADEEIQRYGVSIEVQPSGALRITETIRVRAEGREIRHGIYRDFPTRYTDRFGNKVRVAFVVESVQRNGVPEPYHVEPYANGERVLIGSKDALVSTGIHTYTLVFRTDRQLGFFPDHDELYFNAIGTGWIFPITSSEIDVRLPGGIAPSAVDAFAFLGPEGTKLQDYRMNKAGAEPAVHFSATRTLQRHEGFTVVVQWPKGFVHEPTAAEKLRLLVTDNADVLIAVLGLLVSLAYGLLAWMREGRDPKQGVVIPLFGPPKNFTPAGCRYVMRMKFDPRAFTAALIDLGVKGYVHIVNAGGTYTLNAVDPKKSEEGLPEEEQAAYLLVKSNSPLVLKQDRHQILRVAIDACKQYLEQEHSHRMFELNQLFIIPHLLIAALTFGGMLASQHFIAQRVMNASNAVVLVCYLIWLAIFVYLIKRPTVLGRRVMDQIEGFKMYLATAEEGRLNAMNPPEKTPELFEKFLPYALALDVEQAWSERFSAVFAKVAAEQGQAYHPRWYSGSDFDSRRMNAFTSSVGSGLSRSIAASATPPGSSSGSGGSSGGGGGGGGGGGW